jgi:TonB family protein
VVPPPQATRPQLPLAVKGGLATKNDWALTFIVAFSFLAHFGLVGAMYSDWSDPIVGDHDVAGLIDMITKIPPPPVEVPDESKPSSVTNAPLKAQPESTKPTPGPVANNHPNPNPNPSPPAPMSDARSAALAARGEAMQMQVLTGLNAGPAVQSALDRSNVPAIDLSSAAERNIGAARSTGDLKTTTGGPVAASTHNGLGTLGNVHADGNNQPGKETNVGSPIPIAQVGITTTTTPIPNPDGTIAALRGRFRNCYQTGLLGDSTMAGKVMISAKVGPNGEVISADVVSISGLSPAVGQCIAGVVKRATFNAPGGGGSTVQIPVTFLQQPQAK